MLAALTDDLDTIFSTDDFAIDVTFTPAGGSAVTINGIFDDEDVEVEQGDEMVIIHQTKLTCPKSYVLGVANGDAITANSVAYTVRFIKDDGWDVYELFLEKN